MAFSTPGMTAPPKNIGVPEDAVVSIPGGKTLNLKQLKDVSFGYNDPHEFLGQPEKLLKNVDPKKHYGWPIKSNATQGKCRQGVYRVIRPEEIKDDTPYAIATQDGVGGGQVEWENHILVEYAEEYYKAHYEDAAWQGTLQLARRAQALQREAADKVGIPIQTHLTATPVTSF